MPGRDNIAGIMVRATTFTICLVGRPNVGKSTIFNKLTRSRRAIVDDMPGVTRDRMFGSATLSGVETLIIDTGGIEMAQDDIINKQVREQALLALEEADVICFVVDGKEGISPLDSQITGILRRTSKRVVLAVNKLDNPKRAEGKADFYELGFADVVGLSAEHSLGLGELADVLTRDVPDEKRYVKEEPLEEEAPEAPLTIAVVGRPNVGKSSLINRILGEKRLMVSDIAGTTRDAVDTSVRYHGKEYVFIDTAGIRRKARISQKLEKFSVIMSLKGIERAELALLVLDATQGVSVQDERVAGLINGKYRACIILVNKWDLVEKDTMTAAKFQRDLEEKLKFIGWAPVLFVSAETGQRIHRIFETIEQVKLEFRKRIDTGPLNRKINTWTSRVPPPIVSGHRPKFYFITQPYVAPPTFVFFVSKPACVAEPYQRYLANRIREDYGFAGAPIKCVFEHRPGRHTKDEKPRREPKPTKHTEEAARKTATKRLARTGRKPARPAAPAGKKGVAKKHAGAGRKKHKR